MTRVSTNAVALLAVLLILGTTAYGQNPVWPLKGEIDLSSGYGDLRAGRFHVGLDLRTGGRIGAKVYAPVDGYIWRIKMSYRGYGKGLYLKGDDKHIYVFGHLSGFPDAITKAVTDEQFQLERYYVELTFPPDSIRVKKGDLIAFSGQTGVGAPHLHFEKRTADNLPLNPLLHGFDLDDRVPPTLERLGIQLLDNHSLFAQGRRKLFLPVKKISAGKYRAERTLALDAPFGFLVDGFDQMRPGGMRQAIHKLTMYIDSVPYYESVFDTLPFEVGSAVSLLFDPAEAANGERRVRRMFRPVAQDAIWPEARACYGGRSPGTCAYGVDSPPRVGRHEVLIVGEDAAGNRSELTFHFNYVEPGSTESAAARSSYEFQNDTTPTLEGYELADDGLIMQIRASDRKHYLFFRAKSPHETLLDPHDLESYRLQDEIKNKGIDLAVVGWDGDRQLRSGDDQFTLTVPKGALFRPQFLAVKATDPLRGTQPIPVSQVYRVEPQSLPMKGQFKVAIKLDPSTPGIRQAGLGWSAEKGDAWTWIDNGELGDSVAEGTSSGGGLFTVVLDAAAPTITGLNLKNGHKYTNRRPEVTFKLSDNLSGFEDDRAIDVRIDGQWLLPELDVETGRCVAKLKGPLDIGKHQLSIVVLDRAGNRAERTLEFEIVKQSKSKSTK
ncbi:MAG: M23 family metallopeptidase [Candidatus Zixiibacteriota bacterium]